jgi:hypothetical protein
LLGRLAAWLALGLLAVLERLRMRQRWRLLYKKLFAYWYWRGVVDELGTEAALARYVEQAEVKPTSSEEPLIVDLLHGLDAAEARLHRNRPTAVLLRMGAQELGLIAAVHLAEPLRGEHLRPLLAERFSWQILQALALRETALGAAVPSMTSIES